MTGFLQCRSWLHLEALVRDLAEKEASGKGSRQTSTNSVKTILVIFGNLRTVQKSSKISRVRVGGGHTRLFTLGIFPFVSSVFRTANRPNKKKSPRVKISLIYLDSCHFPPFMWPNLLVRKGLKKKTFYQRRREGSQLCSLTCKGARSAGIL